METQRKIVNRGFNPDDLKNFGDSAKAALNQAGYEIQFLIDQGYEMKSASTFVGNHYLLSERQRLALARMLSPSSSIKLRKMKEIAKNLPPSEVYVDGFNLIILLESALSNSIILKGADGTMRDLSGLRGTYQIIDKTDKAVDLIFCYLKQYHIKKITLFLDKPVSNSGRLRGLILDTAGREGVHAEVGLEYGVDKLLYEKENVVTGDAIILNNCKSWYNMGRWIIEEYMKPDNIFELDIRNSRSN